MSVTTTERSILELNAVAQTAVKLLFQECSKLGIKIFVTETYRSQARQDYLYSLGRTAKGNVVTWTKNSRHTSRLAWDIGASVTDSNKDIYNTSVIKKAGEVAMKLGITWGGQPSWVKAGATDYPHFEVPTTWKIPTGYSLKSDVVVPIKSSEYLKLDNDKVTTTKEEKVEIDLTKITIKDMSNNTLKLGAIDMIDNALKQKLISDTKWLKQAKDETLTVADLMGLKIIIDNAKKK